MMNLDRRDFFSVAAGCVAGGLLGRGLRADEVQRRRKFTMSLACGPLGVRANLQQSIDLAVKYGFEAVEPQIGSIQRMSSSQREQLPQQLSDKNLVWGSTGVPVDIRAGSETEFATQLKQLPAAAQALRSVNATRLQTYIRPSHPELTYRQNFKQHVERIGRIGSIARDFGLRFGLEYVGTRHLLGGSKGSGLIDL